MKHVLFALLFCPLYLLAGLGDTTTILFQNKMDMNYYGSYDFKGKFPDGSKTYRQVVMKYTLGCSSLGCSGWDYTNNIQLIKPLGIFDSTVQSIDTTGGKHDTTWKKTERTEKFELGRVITPYGTYMKAGTNGYQPSWQHQYLFDITDYVSLLKDSATMRCFYSGYTTGFAATVDFYFIEGTPPRNVLKIENVWGNGGNGFGYGNPDTFEKKVLPKKTISIVSTAKSASLQFTPSGHGGNNSLQAAEFYDEKAQVFLNNTKIADMRIWRDDCGKNPIAPQGGTWVYDRANWCPGSKVNTFTYEITGSQLHPGATDDVDIDFDPYTVTGSGGPSYIISSVFVQYGENNFTNDVTITDILSPSTNENHKHYNPVCYGPTIEIKNNGKNAVTTCIIKYGLSNGAKITYTWNGNLAFNQTKQITLPSFNWTGAVNGSVFVAEITSVNNTNDEWNFDNKRESTIGITPKQDADIIVWFKTNNRPAENSYKFLDWGNNVVFQRGGFTTKNFVYKDTVHLAIGCYTFLMSDAGGDGVSWWADTAAGIGTLSFKRMNGSTTKNFNMDFGSEILYNFTTAYLSGIETVLDDNEVFSVFPNPTNGNVKIQLFHAEQLSEIQVYNMNGKLVHAMTNTNGEDTLNIDILVKGIYLIKVTTGEKAATRKLVVE